MSELDDRTTNLTLSLRELMALSLILVEADNEDNHDLLAQILRKVYEEMKSVPEWAAAGFGRG